MLRPAFLLLTALLLPPSAAAQDLRLVSATPGDGAAGVPLEATITFEFTEPLDPSTSSWNVAVVEPADAIYISRYELCVNPEPCGGEGNEQRYIRYLVQHQPDTDYTWFVHGAKARSGSVHSEPFVLRYTTAAEAGTRSVTGTVFEEEFPAVMRDVQTAYFRTLVSRLEAEGQGKLVLTSAVSESRLRLNPMALPDELQANAGLTKNAATSSTSAQQGGYTRILLLDEFAIEEDSWSILAGTAIEGPTGSYTVEHVRDGTYWPLAVHFTDATALQIDRFGFYDPNGDLSADPIVISGGSVADIDIPLFSFPLSTAQANLEAAWSAAREVAEDHELYVIDAGYGARPSGDAYNWNYRFYSHGTGIMSDVGVGPLGTEVQNTAVPSIVFDPVEPVPTSFVGSADALDIVLDAGGEEFLSIYRPDNVLTFMTGGNLRSRTEFHKDKWFWYVDLMARTSTSTKHFIARVDMVTGELLEEAPPSSASRDELPGEIRFAASYPNPFTVSTTIPFELDRPSSVTLAVYNVLGQRVALLLNDTFLAEGTHRADWHGGQLPSGLYVFELRSGDRVLYQPVLLTR